MNRFISVFSYIPQDKGFTLFCLLFRTVPTRKKGYLPMSRKVVFTLNILIVIGMLMAGQSEAAAQSPSPQAVSMYNLGLNAYKMGSLDSAIIFFKRATDLDPNLYDAQYNLGVLYKSQRRFKEAIPRFEEVLRIKPSDAEAHYQLGQSLQAQSRFPEAKQHYLSIPPSSPSFPEAQKRVAECDRNQAPASSPAAQTAQIASTPAYQAPQTEPIQTPVQSQVQTPVQTQATQVQTAPTPAPTVAGKPVAVLANTSVRVIATGFNAPSGLTFDRQGNLYVANFNSNTVDRISSDGTRTQFAAGGHLKGPIGLAADESGNIYVANYSGGTIARITPAGISTVIATGFKQPYYLILDRGGNLFVTQQEDNSIVRVTLPRTVVFGNGSSAR